VHNDATGVVVHGIERHEKEAGHRAITLFLGPKLETYMNIKIQKLLPISAAAMLFASLATGAVADEVVKIGHVAPLTGGIAHLGKDNENGARLAVEEINAKGLTGRTRRRS
jgi:branched-chain amino acid transport system substrate-binding protein